MPDFLLSLHKYATLLFLPKVFFLICKNKTKAAGLESFRAIIVSLVNKSNYFLLPLNSIIAITILGTCKMHGIEPYAWLKNVLEKIATHPINRIKELLPHNSK